MLFGASNQSKKKTTPPPTAQITDWQDQRRDMINHSTLRNDLEVFRFDQDQSSFGVGGAHIHQVYFTDTKDQALHWVVGGEIIRLVILVQTHRLLDQPIIGFYIKDRLGQTLFGDNTYISYQDAPVVAEENKLLQAVFEFPMPILPKGDYSVAVAVANGTQEQHTQHHWIHDALLFTSHSSAAVTGLVGIPMKHIELSVVS